MINNIYFRGLVIGVLVCFPGLANLVQSGGSASLIFIGLMGLLTSVFQKERPSFSFEEKCLMWAFAGYFLTYLVSGVFNSLSGVLPEMRGKHFEKEAYLLLFIPACYLFRRIKISPGVVWWGVSLGGIVVGLYSMVDFGWIDVRYRVRGAYNPIMFGCLSLTMAFMAIQGYQYFRRRHFLLLTIPLAGFFFGTVSSLLTGSRGAWIAIPAFLAITLFHLKRVLRNLEITVIVGIFFLALVAAYTIPDTGMARRFELVKEDLLKYSQKDVTLDNSIGIRLASWKASWVMAKHHLLLGIGPGGYEPTIKQMVSEGKLPYKAEVYHSQPHNIYFSVLVDSGLLGVLFLLTILFLPLKIFINRIWARKGDNPTGYAGLILSVGYIHFGLTETIFGRNLFVAFYILMVAMLLRLSLPSKLPD